VVVNTINKINRRRARFLLGWLTSPLGQLSPVILCWLGGADSRTTSTTGKGLCVNVTYRAMH